MITTPRVAKFLQALPDGEATRILDAVHAAAADPLANPRHCKHLGPDLWEVRVSLPPSRQFRCMFSYRRDGVPVLLSGCLKKSTADHERAIRAARAELASDEAFEGVAMAKNEAPFTVRGWIYTDAGRQLRITHHTRKKILVETDDGRVTLDRRRLESVGEDVVDGVRYRVSRYALPIDMEIAS